MKTLKFLIYASIFLILMNFASASISINEVDQKKIYPGESGIVEITLNNNFDENIEDLSLFLDLASSKNFAIIGSSEQRVDEIKDDRSKTLTFEIKALSSSEPGDYQEKYRMEYMYNGSKKQQEGTLGLRIEPKLNVDYLAYADKPLIGEKTRLNLKIINKGYGEIKFVSVKITAQGFKLISSEKYYIGSIPSDDYDTANFDVLFEKSSNLIAEVTYSDIENNQKTDYLEIPIKVYDTSEAVKLGLIQKSNSKSILLVLIVGVIVFFIIRRVRKKKALEKAKQQSN